MGRRKHADTPETQAAPAEISIDNARAELDAGDVFSERCGAAYKLLGQIDATSYVKKVVTIQDLILIRQMKESKLYKNLKIQVGEKLVTCYDFSEFCEFALGVSREKIDLDLLNLAALGEEFYAASQKMGLTYRQLRALRALPEGELEDVKALVDNPEAIQEALDRHKDEKAKLKKEIKEKNDRLDTQETMLADADTALREAKEKLIKYNKLTPDEQRMQREEAALKELTELQLMELRVLGEWTMFHSKAEAIMFADVPPSFRDQVTAMVSTVCVKIAEDLRYSGIAPDFSHEVYPDHLVLQNPEKYARMKPEQLPRLGTEESDQKLARQALADSEVAKGYAALAREMPGIASIQLIRSGLEKTAAKLLRMNGGDVEAARKILDGRMETLTGANYALVYDTGAGLSSGKIQEGLRAFMGKKLENFLEDVPFRDKFARQDRLADLRRRGLWANAPDGRGYVLFDPVAQAPVLDGKGRIYRATDEDLRGVAPPVVEYNHEGHLP